MYYAFASVCYKWCAAIPLVIVKYGLNFSEPELVLATKEVAKSLGGDVKETESELLSTLRLHSTESTTGTATSLRLVLMSLSHSDGMISICDWIDTFVVTPHMKFFSYL